MADKNSPDKFKIPRSLMKLKRTEFISQIELNLKKGIIPSDLQGHVFLISPVGFANTPYGDGTPLFNGDSMVYRLDFDKPGKISLKSRIAKTPCYFADEATQTDERFKEYQFKNFGLGRFSLLLGLRNQVNTGFLSAKFSKEQNARLFITYDAGRPYEIDTDSLKVVTPVGSKKEWESEVPISIILSSLKLRVSFPFPPTLSTAHPEFDKQTSEMFMVNYIRDPLDLLESIPLTPLFIDNIIKDLKKAPHVFTEFLEQKVRQFTGQGLIGDDNPLIQFFNGTKNFLSRTYLIRWDGRNTFERWKLMLPDGLPVTIKQSMHQIGITEDYVILADTSFKFELEQLLDNSFPALEIDENLRRCLTTRAQLPDTTLYIVHRQDLRSGQRSLSNEPEIEVIAQKITIPLEVIHFYVDYKNPGGKITLHACHNPASDVAEWIHDSDTSAYNHHPTPPWLRGLMGSQMDIGRLGRYVLDGNQGVLFESKVIHDLRRTWGIGLSTYDQREQVAPIRHIYLQSFGFHSELLTDFIFNLYKDYKYRLVSLEQLKIIQDEDRPPCLFRLDTETMTIDDCYEFSIHQVINSPQFVPRNHSANELDGYIVCTVISDEGDEIWIFNAAKLNEGPICQLDHPSLDLGYTLHTTWLSSIGPRTADYYVPVREDYELNKEDELTKELFEEAIYPKFEHG
ncbi:MAG: carotenoid oxygenase family protein [Gloeobacterales cyanobacterium]